MPEKFAILIVDDNANNRFTLRSLLRQVDRCEIYEADSGENALIQTIEHDIDLILLDVQMPIMDGFETAKHLQMTERTREIPIVFVTAVFKSEEFIQQGYQIGAVDYLTKPIDDNLLLNRIRLYQRLFEHQRELEKHLLLLQQHEQELTQLKNIAEAANRAKSIFLSNMSHELRTPLNAILGFSHLLEQDSLLTEQHKTTIATINRAGRHLLNLINDILELSRIEAGRIELHNETFDLPQTLDSIADLMRIQAENKGLQFQVEYPHELPRYVLGDAKRLRQVLMNLLGNAIKFTKQGQVFLQVSPPQDNRVGFCINDTGPGLTPTEQKRLFHAFYQTDTGVAQGEGSGLGLIISREFVRLMGGDITVSSEIGQGSKFCFSLTLPETAVPVMPAFSQKITGLATDQSPVRVLIADDDIDSCQLLKQILVRTGFEVKMACNGEEAIAVFQSWQPHFIWMDMKMPVLDGYRATQTIRSLDGGNDVKIVAQTSSAFAEERSDIFSAGCDDIVCKPVEEQQLLQMMGKLLNLHYCYQDATLPVEESLACHANLHLLPESLIATLKEAAEQLDVEAILHITEQMTDYPAQVKMIKQWVNNFRFDLLLTALKNNSYH